LAPLPPDGYVPYDNYWPGGGYLWGTVQAAWGRNTYFCGSYAPNGWLLDAGLNRFWPRPVHYFPRDGFHNQNEVIKPANTPIIGDGIHEIGWPLGSDPPPADLSEDGGSIMADMRVFAIPRHGSRPNPMPTKWPSNLPLPGAVNVSFFDGHGELVKLDRLWQLYWSPGYQPPDKRPGLP
jgi:prepilin-type processing-associated H-X9-DG protein